MAYTPPSLPNVSMPTKLQHKIEYFAGIDLTTAEGNISPNRSPYCPNMIRDSKGTVKKRTGFHTTLTLSGNINGVHFWKSGGTTKKLIHAGTKIYYDNGTTQTELYSSAADAISTSIMLDTYLCIFDGLKALRYDGTNLVTLESVAYIPTILIGRAPSGGGTAYEPINLLTASRKEKFTPDGVASTFTVSGTIVSVSKVELDSVEVPYNTGSGKNYTISGNSIQLKDGTNNYVPPSATEDKLEVTYSIAENGASKINSCTIATLYGVNGDYNRVFVSGNSNFPHYDWYCQINDVTYWGDIWYSVLGASNSPIVGYSVIDGLLATHKNSAENDINVYLREGKIINDEAAFTITNSIQGKGAISKHSFATLENEPLFLTSEGIYAITKSDVLSDKYSQLRGYYLNGKLLNESNLENAYAAAYKEFYFLAINNKLYILDGMQPVSEANVPYSNRQYEGYLWTDIANVRVLWVEDGALCFGTTDGKLCAFHTETDRALSYSDNGVAISAYWTTPEIYGNDFYKNKTFSKVAVTMGTYSATGIKISKLVFGGDNLFEEVKTIPHGIFSYSGLTYSTLSYNTDTSPYASTNKLKIKKKKKTRLKLENSMLNQSFSILGLAIEFTQNS